MERGKVEHVTVNLDIKKVKKWKYYFQNGGKSDIFNISVMDFGNHSPTNLASKTFFGSILNPYRYSSYKVLSMRIKKHPIDLRRIFWLFDCTNSLLNTLVGESDLNVSNSFISIFFPLIIS